MSDPTFKKDQRMKLDRGDTHLETPDSLPPSGAPRSESRRKFLGDVRGVAMAAATVGAIGIEPLLGASYFLAHEGNGHGESAGGERAEEAAEIRMEAMKADRKIPIPPHTTNG